jgi:hypothetical protein
MKILGCFIILTDNYDEIYLETDVPGPFYKQDTLQLRFQAPCGSGEEYVRNVVGIEEVTVKDARLY